MQRLFWLFFLSSLTFLVTAVVAFSQTRSRPLVEIRVQGFGAERVDRCSSCHEVEVGSELPGPHPPVPGHHPVERFGCAACHGGEGRALVADRAHRSGREPLFHLGDDGREHRERLEVGCARCHLELDRTGPIYDPDLAPLSARGSELFRARGCWGCHALAHLSTGERGPDLSEVGARLSGDQLRLAIDDPSASPSSTTMPNLRLPEPELSALVVFLMAQVDAERAAAIATARQLETHRPGTPPARPPVDEGMAAGADVMLRLGCVGCHRLQSRDGQVGPDLRWEGELRGPRYIRDMVQRPSLTVVGSRMPPIELTRSELDAVGEFLARQRSPAPMDEERAWREICARCHGLDGRGRTAVAPYLSRRPRDLSEQLFFSGVPSSRLARTLREGVPGTPMAPWGRALPIFGGRRVVSFLGRHLHHGGLPSPRRLRVPRPPEELGDEARAGAQRVFEVECSSCHGPNGRGNGVEAAGMRPRPRDLGNGAFIDSLRRRRLFLSIAYGPVASEMPGHLWGNSPETLWALVDMVQRLAGEPLTGTYDEDRHPWQRPRRRRRPPRRPPSKAPAPDPS